jgi:hypothetical protein
VAALDVAGCEPLLAIAAGPKGAEMRRLQDSVEAQKIRCIEQNLENTRGCITVKSCEQDAILGGYEDPRAEAIQPSCQCCAGLLDSVTGEQQLPSSQCSDLQCRLACAAAHWPCHMP